MRTRLAIAALIYSMIQGVLFGTGVVLVLATPLADFAMQLMPWVVISTTIIAVPLAWWLAPRLRARYWRGRRHLDTADKMLASLS